MPVADDVLVVRVFSENGGEKGLGYAHQDLETHREKRKDGFLEAHTVVVAGEFLLFLEL